MQALAAGSPADAVLNPAKADPNKFLQGFEGNFDTDLFTGSANYALPIQLPAGRGQATPPLSLNYSSSGLTTGECEATLSPGLGKYIPEAEKERLFADASKMAGLLAEVVARRTQEEKAGKRVSSAKQPASADPARVKPGMEQLGRAERRRAERQRRAEGKRIRPGLKQLRSEDLPPGVTAARSYDHRGHCVMFEHDTLGELGKIVVIGLPDGETLLQAEFCLGQDAPDSPAMRKRQRLFEQVAATVQRGFAENFPQ